MPTVKTAEQATDIAIKFARKYLPLLSGVSPLRASQANGSWIVELDIGTFLVKKATITVDADSGDVVEYTFPD